MEKRGSRSGFLTVSDLPSKQVGREGMINSGVVVAVVDPGEFYILPTQAWECACKIVQDDPEDRDVPTQSFSQGGDVSKPALTAYNEMMLDLATSVKRHHMGDISRDYAINDLVAVKLKTAADSGNSSWFRAVILGDEHASEDGRSISLRLLDVGTCVEKPLEDVIRLPAKFCTLSPMAYRCSLFGISPLTHRWTKSATQKFKTLVERLLCIFEVKRTIDCKDVNTFEKNPYQVQLLVQGEGVYQDVSQALASDGLGLKWNFTPSRPLVAATLDGELWNLMAAENDKPGQCLHTRVLKPDNQGVISREIKRMEKLMGRLNFEYVAETSGESLNSSLSNSVEDLVDDTRNRVQ